MKAMNGRKLTSTIRNVTKTIKRLYHPEQVIVFGSHAYGNPGPASDLDLLVIMDTELKPYQQAARIEMGLGKIPGVRFPIDIVVRTPQELKRRIKLGDFFFKKVMEDGIPA